MLAATELLAAAESLLSPSAWLPCFAAPAFLPRCCRAPARAALISPACAYCADMQHRSPLHGQDLVSNARLVICASTVSTYKGIKLSRCLGLVSEILKLNGIGTFQVSPSDYEAKCCIAHSLQPYK